MERRELLERLAPLIPPPRTHRVRYHGVLAPCASGRDRVVPTGSRAEDATAATQENGHAERSESLARRIAWAELLKRVFEVDALRCPACGGLMRLIAAITEPSVARRILECLALPPRSPPLSPAIEVDREPIVGRSGFEQTTAEANGDPGFEFDQTLSELRSSDEDV